MKSLKVIMFAVVALAAFARPAAASIYDPAAGWRTLSSEHFAIHYPERIHEVAQKSALILEEFYPEAVEIWNWRPFGKTQVVLLDNTDLSNGMAAVLPYNFMIIYVSPPPPDSSLAHYDDWLRMLLIHEFTHIVQIDAVGGVWRPLRFVFGKTVSPSGMNPVWFREGIAQFGETYFTEGGRGRGSYSEMVVRMSVLDDDFPAIDQADGLGWRWPGYKGAYIYGIKFTQWLVDTYGVDKFKKLDKRIRSSIMLGFLNHQTRNVYGKTFYELWNEWRQDLIDEYRKERASIESQGLSAPQEIVLKTERDKQYGIPTVSPNGRYLVYQVTSPHSKPSIWMLDLTTGEKQLIKKGHSATQFGFSRDGTKLVYSRIARYKHFNRFFDVWMYDFTEEKPKKRLKRLTVGERARDPEFDLSGRNVIFVAGDAGTQKLKRINVESRDVVDLTPNVPAYTQFANPRVSPDGRFMALSVWSPGVGWRVWKYTIDGAPVTRLTKTTGLVVESRPAWTSDGGHLIFSSDEGGIANLYRVRPDGKELTRITNVLSGVYQPSVAPDGRIFAQYYTSKGFVIAAYPYSPGSYPAVEAKKYRMSGYWDREGRPEPDVRVRTKVVTRGVTEKVTKTTVREAPGTGLEGYLPVEEVKLTDRNYVAWGAPLFLPRFIVPAVTYTDDTLFATAFTGGSDALRWHNWIAGVSYRLDAKHLGYFGRYWYNRHKLIFGVSFRDYAVDFGQITFDYDDDPGTTDDQRTVHYYEHRRGVTGFLALPVGNHMMSLAYFYEDHLPKTTLTQGEQDALNLGIFAGLRGEYKYRDWEKFPASISKENGRTIRLTGSVTNKHLGSADRNEQIIFSGDWREYVRLWRHNVLAVRAAGGMTWGDQLVQGTFGLGGAVGEGPLASGGSYTYFPLRGLPVSALSRTRAMLFSAEYRFPIVSPLRGFGTAPVFVKDISGAIFVDYGNAWNAHEAGSDSFNTFFDQFLMGVGFELRGNFIIGHGLPIHGRLGYGIIVVNRDRVQNLKDPLFGTDIKYGTMILTLGFSF